MYVTDWDLIQVFTAEEKILRRFVRRGVELKKFRGVGIDFSDRVYVSDHDNQSVSVFTSEGLKMVKKIEDA